MLVDGRIPSREAQKLTDPENWFILSAFVSDKVLDLLLNANPDSVGI